MVLACSISYQCLFQSICRCQIIFVKCLESRPSSPSRTLHLWRPWSILLAWTIDIAAVLGLLPCSAPRRLLPPLRTWPCRCPSSLDVTWLPSFLHAYVCMEGVAPWALCDNEGPLHSGPMCGWFCAPRWPPENNGIGELISRSLWSSRSTFPLSPLVLPRSTLNLDVFQAVKRNLLAEKNSAAASRGADATSPTPP
jgi:hypothetical protein